MSPQAPSEAAPHAARENWFRRIPSAWLVGIALVVLIVITAVRLIWLYRFGSEETSFIQTGSLFGMVGTALVPFLVGGLLLLWRPNPDRNAVGLAAVAFAAGAASYLVAFGALVLIDGFQPTAVSILLGSLLGGFYTTLSLLPVGLYALKSRPMRVSVAMGLSAVMLALPFQPVFNIVIFVIALFVLRRIDGRGVETS